MHVRSATVPYTDQPALVLDLPDATLRASYLRSERYQLDTLLIQRPSVDALNVVEAEAGLEGRGRMAARFGGREERPFDVEAEDGSARWKLPRCEEGQEYGVDFRGLRLSRGT